MSCSKCEGQVRYDPTKKILLYKWGCDWLPLPNSALGSLPDAPPPGDDELPDLPDLPDGDSSQNYACRKAVVIMSVIYEKASEILTYATENNFTDFVKKVGLGNTTDVSRSLKAIYDAQLDPVTFALYTDYIANEDILTDHICAVSSFLSKTPGLTDSEYDQISDYIDSLASLARNILRLAKARLSLVEANRMAQAAAFDESVPCPCGADITIAPPKPSLATWSVEANFTSGTKGVTITSNNPPDQYGEWVTGKGFKSVNRPYQNEDTAMNWLYLLLPSFESRRVLRIDYEVIEAVEGVFASVEGTPDNDIEKFSVRLYAASIQPTSISDATNGWHSFVLNNTLSSDIRLWGWCGYQEIANPTPSEGTMIIRKIRIHGTGTKPPEFTTLGWTDVT